jgi:excisionase family DNA binding protein
MEQKTIDTADINKAIATRALLYVNPDVKTPQVAPHLQLLSIKEVCRRLCIGRWMVYQLINENKLGSITIGKRRLIPVQELQKLFTQSESRQNG